MKLEVGMYCFNETNRKLGIGEIISFQRNNNVNVKYKNDIELVSIGNIKASNDIEDLIKVGDVLTFKDDNDVYKVNCIPNKKSGCEYFYLEFDYENKFGVEDIQLSVVEMKNSLESIMTKEQFESVSYKVIRKEVKHDDGQTNRGRS